MFIAVKDQIGIEVECEKNGLAIIPFCINQELNGKAKEIANEEADHAIAFLESKDSDSEELLKMYFEEKGWKITATK